MMIILITYENWLKVWLMPPLLYWGLQMFTIDTSLVLLSSCGLMVEVAG